MTQTPALTGSSVAGSTAPTALFNPRTFDASGFDEETRRVLLATIEWFEARGKVALKRHHHDRTWYADFLDFIARERVFATLLTPAAEGGGDADKRWDTARICAFNEITAFYGLGYWYTWQVSILGLGPIWQSENAAARARAAGLLDDGAIFAFGLSEQTHGADIYSTDMILTPDGDGGFIANGGKYYIGNGNLAGMVSVFGRRADVEGPDGYVFFAADSQAPTYELIKNVVNGQMYVSAFHLHDHPVSADDVLHTGREAFDAALNTVNVGKFNLGFASIGIAEHAFYEAITHAHARVLYGRRVTDFPHVQQMLTDAYARLLAMKLFGERAIDYFRSANAEDRRYLLFNPITKMKVTTEGERVIDLLWDVIAARVRGGHVLRDGRDGHPRAAEARGHGPREHGARPEVHGRVLLRTGGVRAGAAAPRAGRRRVPLRPGPDARALEDPLPGLARAVRALGRPAERGALHGAGRRAPRAARQRPAGREPAEGPGLHADAG